MELEELLAAKDFRLDKLVGKPLYFTPADAHARAQMNRLWGELTGHHPGAAGRSGRQGAQVARAGRRRWAWRASASPSCASGRWAPTTISHIAHAFHTVLIDAIPVLRPAQREVARRFVNLIDALYDNRVCLIASADDEPQALYPAGDVHFLFERTASRLIEMRSESYLTGRIDRLSARVPA